MHDFGTLTASRTERERYRVPLLRQRECTRVVAGVALSTRIRNKSKLSNDVAGGSSGDGDGNGGGHIER